MVVAAERSSDKLGSALLERLPITDARGVVGPAMASRVRALGSVDELGIVGIPNAVRAAPRLQRLLARLRRDIAEDPPDVLITIDGPSFNLRLARSVACPTVHWVAPQVWAWRPWRARRVTRSVDALGCLFPFEPGLFGAKARFVGHPAAACEVSERPMAIGVAAGSRTSERARLGPVFAEAVRELGLPVVEAVPPGMTPVTDGRVVEDVAHMAPQVCAAVCAAGTATLELGCAGVPTVVAYHLDAVSHAVARALVRVPNIALPNLVLGREVMPEHVHAPDVPAIRADLERMIRSDGAGLLELRRLLKGETAIEEMADLVQTTVSKRAARMKSASVRPPTS